MRRYKPIRDPKTHTVTIDKIGLFGEGIAEIEGGVVFVPHAAVGETCEVLEVERRKHFINTKKIKTIKASPYAVEPQCQYFGQCGGCQLQNLDYDEQVKQKQQILSHFVREKLHSDLTVEALACPTPYGYRKRIRLRQNDGRVGFFQNKSLNFIEIKSCETSVPEINQWLSDQDNFPRPETQHDISLDVDNDGNLKIYEGKEQNQMGFQQVNAWGETVLRQMIEQTAKDKIEKGVLELYSGAGGLTLSWFKPESHQLYFGIDNDGVNIQNAIKRYQSADNIQFAVGHLPEWLIKKQQETPEFTEQFDTIILDPARGGVGQSLKKLQPMPAIKQWIYVSCNPTSWYKDVRTLIEKHNVRLERVVMVDMFPQTRHFEIFSVLSVG